MAESFPPTLPGADAVLQWFGRWPSFHDAEVLDLKLDRDGISALRVHTWRTTKETEAGGRFRRDLHAVVTFWLEDVVELELNGFSVQNVISGLDVESIAGGFRIKLHPCYGLAGEIEARRIAVSLSAGEPQTHGAAPA